jgi:hypothetical protein
MLPFEAGAAQEQQSQPRAPVGRQTSSLTTSSEGSSLWHARLSHLVRRGASPRQPLEGRRRGSPLRRRLRGDDH